jgi:general secretion pathway protein K
MIARRKARALNTHASQGGVALIQVLFLSAIISLLALRMTYSARDQIQMAEQLEGRVRAQLASYSAINEVIFLQLSNQITQLSGEEGVDDNFDQKKRDLNLYGDPIVWREGVSVSVQDLNGILPQLFPTHQLWPRMLAGLSVTPEDIESYLGVWEDMQDSDTRGWIFGDVEPANLPTGESYPNAFAQNDKFMRWIFYQQPSLLSELLNYSHIHGAYDTNLLNTPRALLHILFDETTASAMIEHRSNNIDNRGVFRGLIPTDIDQENIVFYNSGFYKIKCEVEFDGVFWRQQRVVHLSTIGQTPFQIYLNE